ncbi:hypothetical protein FB382_000564 [Nocardioides ginsengisegetis]|uniref:DUF3592 domain-containing protein n=1 Tax=Nocardioides ginsengisegetis TaxID=661491 RepID=A0A7W3P8B4_9ACTN|nr:DUF3592 domain-containing protein [Nocardioides ginsengisegetis]MBA8802273.1 hypothetical protein [Nocardioides ginsengisegetis]
MTLHPGPGYLTLAAAVVALVLGLGFVVRGFLQRRAATAFADRAVATTAVVTAVHPKDVAVAGEPLTIYFTEVRFTVDGQEIETDTITGIEPPTPRVDDEVTVRYDPRRPRRVELADVEGEAHGAGLTSFAIARVLLALALLLPAAWGVLTLVVFTG